MVNKLVGIGIVVVMLVVMIGMSGCTMESPTNEMEKNAGIENTRIGTSFKFEQKFTEANQQKLINSNPPPKLEQSLERENLINRYTLLYAIQKIFF